jgi:hypothetical protein
LKKLFTLFFVFLGAGNFAEAKSVASIHTSDPSDKKLKDAFETLVKAGVVGFVDEERAVIDPKFIQFMKQTGVIDEVHASAGTLCTGK